MLIASLEVLLFCCFCGRIGDQDETGLIAKRFEFDNVFTPASTQEEVFGEVRGVQRAVVYGLCRFAGLQGAGCSMLLDVNGRCCSVQGAVVE